MGEEAPVSKLIKNVTPPAALAPLTHREKLELARWEKDVEYGFRSAGTALAAIRDAKLYRAEHGTFEDYVKARWSYKPRYAYYLMDAAATASEVGVSLDSAGVVTDPGRTGKAPARRIVPTAEGQVRPLMKLAEEQRPEAWKRAVEAAGYQVPSAKQVASVVAEMCTNGAQKPAPKTCTNCAQIRRALSALRSISKPSKNTKAAIDLLTRELDDGRNKTSAN